MEFLKSDRDSYRLLNISEKMARIIYSRLKSFVLEESQNRSLKPFGFGIEGE